MSNFDKYVLFLCLTVFAALASLFAALIVRDVKNTLKMIEGGLSDKEIIQGLRKKKAKRKRSAALGILGKIASGVFVATIFALAVFCFISKINEKKTVKNIPSLKTVQSGSMATKYEKNGYLSENGLNDQIEKFDLILLRALPEEKDLKLYDIVAYESDGILIIHRIVSITEPDETHEERLFLLQGDANAYPDKFPVRYAQMRGVYRGERAKFIGSFVIFLQSPAGYLCFGAMIFTVAVYPFAAKKIEAAAKKRMEIIGKHDD